MGLWGGGGGPRVYESPAHDCSAASPLQSWHGAGRQAALHEALLVHLHKHITGSEWVRGPSGLLRQTEEGRLLGAGSAWRALAPSSVAAAPAPLCTGRRPSPEAFPATSDGFVATRPLFFTIICTLSPNRMTARGPFPFPVPSRQARSSVPRSPAPGLVWPTLCGTKSLAPSVLGARPGARRQGFPFSV